MKPQAATIISQADTIMSENQSLPMTKSTTTAVNFYGGAAPSTAHTAVTNSSTNFGMARSNTTPGIGNIVNGDKGDT